MPLTIKGTYTIDGYRLTGSSFGVLNPVTVTGSIDAGTAGTLAALYGQGPGAWTIANLGTITGESINGVELAAGGIVVNGTSGSVAGNYAIRMNAGGGVTNEAGGQISGQQMGVAIPGLGTLVNDGTIGGTSKDGVYLASGLVTNQSRGTIGGVFGVVIKGGGSLSNAGRVSGGPGTNQSGVYLNNGTITNQSGGYVTGGWGLYVHGAGDVTNAGTVMGTSQGGSFLGGGTLNNSGTMTGVWGVAIQGGAGTVSNSGVLNGTGQSGAYLSGGLVTNEPNGTIEGVSGVVIRNGPGTIINGGEIAATSTSGQSVYLPPGFSNQVSVQPGAVFLGLVNGGNTVGATAVSTLELMAGATAGTLSGIGTQFIDFAETTIDARSAWTWTGANTLAAGTTLDVAGTLTLSHAILNGTGTVTGDGSIDVDASTLTVTAVSGSGAIVISAGATVTSLGNVGAGETIAFAGGGGVLNLAFPGFAGTIAGFDATDTIDLAGVTDASTAGIVNGDTLQVQRTGHPAISLVLDPDRNYTGAVFAVSPTGVLTSDLGRTLSWSGGGGTAFGTAANWDDITDGRDPATAAPAATDTAEFNTNDGAITGTGAVAAAEVGSNGDGVLQLGDGATLTAGTLDAGVIASDVGQIGLTGAGTELSVTGTATVADDGTGVLSVLSGATFAAASLIIGSLGDSSGALIVSGSNSVVNLSGNLNIGTALGIGDLTVGPGAAVHASVVNLQGQVVLEGGLLDPTVQLINQGQTAGGFGTIAAGDIVDEGAIEAGGDKSSQKLLIVQGTVLGGGSLTVNGALPGSVPAGIMQINAGGTLELSGAVLNAATTTFTDNLTPQGTYTVNNSVIDVNFVDSTGVLLLDDIAGFGGTIATWQAGDSFVITDGTLSDLGVANSNTLTVSDTGPRAGDGGIDQVIFGSAIRATGFRIVNGNTIQAQVSCFAAGTRITTDHGPVAVENLVVGDRVVTMDGMHEPIVWIGSRPVNCERHPEPETVWPVRVHANAFGENVPLCDLFLSPDHAVFVDGVLVPVKLLVNGTTIRQVTRAAVTYHHVELARHDVILAEGLPVESYLDIGDRANFHGDEETIRLFPDFTTRSAPRTAIAWETRGAAPLAMAGERLTETRTLLASRREDQPRRFGMRR